VTSWTGLHSEVYQVLIWIPGLVKEFSKEIIHELQDCDQHLANLILNPSVVGLRSTPTRPEVYEVLISFSQLMKSSVNISDVHWFTWVNTGVTSVYTGLTCGYPLVELGLTLIIIGFPSNVNLHWTYIQCRLVRSVIEYHFHKTSYIIESRELAHHCLSEVV